ncbi:60 kDa SS-A/Ro ribonucleoprotein isoform X2 [Acyrthosiphon pisum]|uniref:RNA-binding protein RO60 vWA domain-containing protein n=1 Tax=Acyrthosiphon pisum TaxID=7029 RepID=A0A8R2NS62_ACYPI|nr:60 kDa SS-A/Ro ribonucleoprotein isoform X2 [Acyrthosiphon pisum]
MPKYSLIESKLRRYLYLGHEYCIYVPPSIRTSFWKENHHDDVTGVRIIGKIVKKNKTEEINSIVPIILKIKKEDKLLDDRLLIFALAVCARFNLEPCVKMVADAYAAVSTICTDGLKLLMFVKFIKIADNILFDQGFITIMSNGHGRGFAKSMTNWYLKRDPLLTTEHIVRNKCYDGWSHKDVMKLIHLHSTEPCRIMYIVYTLSGIEKVEKLFGSKMKDVCIEDIDETFENKQLKFIYNFLKQVENIKKMDEHALRYEIELNRWGKEPEVIPQKMLKSSTILTSLVMHLPLEKLLENTFFFAKNRLFNNSTPDVGLWEYILRFNNSILLKTSQIHPIEPFIQYAKYARTCMNILKLQNNIMKKEEEKSVIESIDNKLKVIVKLQKTPDKEEVNDVNQNQPSNFYMTKPVPKLVDQLMTFLSEDLVKKTCEVLDPLGLRIMITYDSRICMKASMCACSRLIKEPGCIGSDSVDSDKKDIPQVYPHMSFKWAKENNKEFDVFVFLGNNKMNLRLFKRSMKGYQTHFKNPVKIILLCLNGKHYDQINLGRRNTLFIIGFDKNVGKLINSFIKDDF